MQNNNKTRLPHQSGFTLVELSVVLVILALLAGGIRGGQSLIRAAQLRNVSVEYAQWKTAIGAFQTRYAALPGDMPNATEYWGRADNGSFSGQCANRVTNQGTGTQTCNGNGDGKVRFDDNEMFRFWQHLANAELIPGNYTGIRGSGGVHHHELGVNAPVSKIQGVGWGFDEASKSGHGGYWDIWGEEPNNTWVVGAPTLYHGPEAEAFTPDEVWSIDTKMDDGKPGQGIMMVSSWRAECTTASSGTEYITAEYRFTEKGKYCRITFPRAF